MDVVKSRADCTSIARSRSRRRLMADPPVPSARYERLARVPGSKELVHGQWIEAKVKVDQIATAT